MRPFSLGMPRDAGLARLVATGGQVRPKNEGSKAWTQNYRG